jgi:hypothetical protein
VAVNRIRSLIAKRAQRVLRRSEDARRNSDVAFDRAHETLLHGAERRRRWATRPVAVDVVTEHALRRRLDPDRRAP